MRHCYTLLGIIVLAVVLRDGPAEDGPTDRIAGLIQQLGHREFAKREAASKELDAIGEPALGALRKAATDRDAEVRQRAERIIQAVTGRIHAAAARKELARWEG